MLFVPLWSAGLQQGRTMIEARWLIGIIVMAAATFAAVFLAAPSGNTTWPLSTLAAGAAASSVAFVLTDLRVKAAAQR